MIKSPVRQNRLLKVEELILITLLFILSATSAYGQQYGLRFSGAEVPQYKRTSLDLNPDGFFRFRNDFTLSFDFSFPPDLQRYYGYIVRIIDNEGTNIDLVFNFRDYRRTALTVIYKNEQTNIFLETNLVELFDNWNTIALAYDFERKLLTLSFADTIMEANDVLLKNRVKFLFGGNDYKHFKTTDVTPMIIKDIKITEGNRLLYHWPLKESSSNSETDLIRNKRAQIQNPTWIKRLYQHWENVYNKTIDGSAAVTYNEKDENIYLLGQNRMTIYNPVSKSSTSSIYNNLPLLETQGRQAFFDTIRDKLILFNVWNTSFTSFDFTSNEWNTIYTGPQNPTLYWHFNKYFLESDSALLIFNGYGQYEFRNIVHRFSLSTNEYDSVQTTGQRYHPRYLAALGELNDTLYLLGGRGSISGQQIESPTNFYDLTAFSLKNNQFTTLYEFIPPVEDAVFANSMFIDETDGNFYALTFPNLEFHSYLQLIRGNLNEPGFELLGDEIPFLFEDILSFADLFYIKSINKLMAVTLFYNQEEDKTNFSVFTISFPPEKISVDISKDRIFFSSRWFVWLIIFIISSIILFVSIILIKHKRKVTTDEKGTTDTESKTNSYESEDLPKEKSLVMDDSTTSTEVVIDKNTIYFFGGFRIFNNDSIDITNKFSPLLKEIFLLVWLNSMKGYNGVSSEKLRELFWFDKDDKKAMNNRSVNIAKLKTLLEEIDSCKLSRKTGYWKIEFDDNVIYNDYWECLKIADNKKILQKEDIKELIRIINKGAFLEDLGYEWLDAFKADISNLMIDTLVDFGLTFDIKKHPYFILNLADTIFKFDIVNEEAMILKCKALISEGKHSLAKNCYEEFIKNFNTLYDTDFDKSFAQTIQ